MFKKRLKIWKKSIIIKLQNNFGGAYRVKIIAFFTSLMLVLLNCMGMTGDNATGHDDYRTYKNVILMIGDGMGFNTIEATKSLWSEELSMESMPVHCQSQTRSASSKVTDSAAGAIGVYNFAGLNVKTNVPKSLCEVAKENGMLAGVVTTDKTSGATPSCFSAHAAQRKMEKSISTRQMKSDLDLIWGAESESVTEALCNEGGFELITTSEEMNALEPGSKSFGQFNMDLFASASHEEGNPYLYEMTEKAIELLDSGDNGFFLMVEAAHIDKFSHKNIIGGATSQVIEFSKAIQVALDFAEEDGDTLVLVTADHETGGITYNEATGEYYYTTGSHTGVDVPVFVSAEDAGFVSGEAYKNCEISVQLGRVLGFDKEQFPATKF